MRFLIAEVINNTIIKKDVTKVKHNKKQIGYMEKLAEHFQKIKHIEGEIC